MYAIFVLGINIICFRLIFFLGILRLLKYEIMLMLMIILIWDDVDADDDIEMR